ncbi:MAG: hypothetical protein RQ885_06405 [Desulfurococcales archaeon]|nr:hypothetical protein [Desulfurococcales archaeon]
MPSECLQSPLETWRCEVICWNAARSGRDGEARGKGVINVEAEIHKLEEINSSFEKLRKGLVRG